MVRSFDGRTYGNKIVVQGDGTEVSFSEPPSVYSLLDGMYGHAVRDSFHETRVIAGYQNPEAALKRLSRDITSLDSGQHVLANPAKYIFLFPYFLK